MTEQIDLDKWKERREALQKSLFGGPSPDQRELNSAELTKLNAEIIDALMNDMAYLQQTLQVTQVQMSNIAQQSFLALEALKHKNVCTAEELSTLHKTVMDEQVKAAKLARATAETAADEAVAEGEKLLEFEALRKQGFSEAEAKATVWPDSALEGAELIKFPGS